MSLLRRLLRKRQDPIVVPPPATPRPEPSPLEAAELQARHRANEIATQAAVARALEHLDMPDARVICPAPRDPAPEPTLTVHAQPWAHGWELTIDGETEVATQAPTLEDAPQQIRDYLDTITPSTDHSAWNITITTRSEA